MTVVQVKVKGNPCSGTLIYCDCHFHLMLCFRLIQSITLQIEFVICSVTTSTIKQKKGPWSHNCTGLYKDILKNLISISITSCQYVKVSRILHSIAWDLTWKELLQLNQLCLCIIIIIGTTITTARFFPPLFSDKL